MLTPQDDYPVHQTPEPLCCPATGDRNFFDRFFFHGFNRAADLFFGVALGLYPNRGVMDAAFSVVQSGRQHTLRSSRAAPRDRGETRVPPIRVDVVEPMRVLRVAVAPNAYGLEADLLFTACTPAVEEPRLTLRQEARLIWDATRLTQFGTWEGWVRVGGERREIRSEEVLGTRDRSWGVRPLADQESGPPREPQVYWIWCPVHFDGVCTHFCTLEDASGSPLQLAGAVVPTRGSPTEPVPHVDGASHAIQWKAGTRWAHSARISLSPGAGQEDWDLELTPLLTFPMAGLGYLHPTWGHGAWKGPRAVHGEVLEISALAPLHFPHVQQLCRVRAGEREGLGVLEQLVIGAHAPSGFRGLTDGA